MAYEAPKDYNDVQARILEFREKYPEGRLTTEDVQILPNVPMFGKDGKPQGNQTYVMVKVAAWRSPDDTTPATAVAWEPLPGRTPYTKESELMNAETSAWGRALIALGAADAKKGLASANEIRNRSGQDQQQAAPQQAPGDPWAKSKITVERLGEVDLLQLREAVAKETSKENLQAWFRDVAAAGNSGLLDRMGVEAAQKVITERAKAL